MRISLIHAMAASVPPIEEAFRRVWPDPTLMNLLDDSLAPDMASEGAFAAEAVAAAAGKTVLTTPGSTRRKLRICCHRRRRPE